MSDCNNGGTEATFGGCSAFGSGEAGPLSHGSNDVLSTAQSPLYALSQVFEVQESASPATTGRPTISGFPRVADLPTASIDDRNGLAALKGQGHAGAVCMRAGTNYKMPAGTAGANGRRTSRRAAKGSGIASAGAVRWMQVYLGTGRAQPNPCGGNRRSGRIETRADFRPPNIRGPTPPPPNSSKG